MNKSIYPQVMYETLERIKPQESRYYDDYRERTEPLENMVSGLILTQHQHLISHILADEKLSRQTSTEVLEAYFETGEFQKVLETLKQYPKQDHEFDLEKYSEVLARQKNEELTLDFAKYLSTLNDHLHHLAALSEVVRHYRNLDLAAKIIADYFPKGYQPLFFAIHHLQEGNCPTSDEVNNIITQFCSIPPKEGDSEWQHQNKLERFVSIFLSELDEKNVDIPVLKSAIVAYEEAKKEDKVGYMSGRYDLDRKVRNYLYENGKFKEAEDFLELTDNHSFHRDEIIPAKINYAIQTKNQALHKEALGIYIIGREDEIAKLGDIFEDSKTDSWTTYAWQKRFDAAKINADINCQFAIFELLHGDEAKAQKYISIMIQEAESIMDISAEYEEGKSEDKIKKNRGHARKRVFRRLKKSLKEDFLQAGLLHFLPRENGWSDTIKSPAQRLIDRKIWEQKGGRRLEYEKREKEQEVHYAKQEAEKTELVQVFLEENKIDDALIFIEQEVQWSCSRADWERGMLVLEYSPDSFHKLFQTLGKDYFSRDSYRSDYSDYESMAQFFVKGSQLGVVQKSDWEELVSRMNEYRFTQDGTRQIPHTAVLSLVKYSIASGNIWQAWEFFESIRKLDTRYHGQAISNSTISACLSHFIRETTNQESRDGTYFAFNDEEIGDEEISSSEQSKYWNTKSNIACAFQDDENYQNSVEELQKTIQNSENPHQAIRTWCRDLVEHCLRDHHQIKNEMEVLLNSDFGKIEKIRRRIIYTLIELGVPGMEAYTDIKKKDSPERAQYFFFKKLVEKNYLTQKTERFLEKDWRENISHLRRLLAQHQNEFNTVIEVLSGAPFESSEWNQVFTALNIVGVITPGIWSQAKSVDFNEDELQQLAIEIKNAKKTMFKNTPLSDELTSELRGELIYQAFKPANMSYHEVCRLLDSFSDCSHHLEKYSIPENGYAIDISQKQDVIFRRGKTENKMLNGFQSISKNKKETLPKDQVQQISRELCDTGRLKIEGFDQSKIENLFLLFLGDDFFADLKELLLSSHGERYQYLQRLKDFLDVYLVDNLEIKILSFFHETKDFTSGIWESFIKSLNTPKKKKNLKNQLGITIPDEVDEKVAAHVIAQAILQKSKKLQALKKSVNQELKNYVQANGEEITTAGVKLKAYVSKNKASFFAKASAGLCTHSDTESFMREDHFHINIVDDVKQECVGNLMAYEMDYNGEKVLLLRGFNPNSSLLKSIDVPSYCESMLDVAQEFAKNNKFDAIYLSEQNDERRGNGQIWYLLSNTSEVKNYLLKKYASDETEAKVHFNVTGLGHIEKMYRVEKFNGVIKKAA